MNEIIKVTTDENGDLLVSGRELHEGLMVKTQYTKWIERKIEKYGFIENTDFVLVSQKRPTNNPKNPFTEITDHALTIDTAKEMAMTENTQKGRDTRRYFIEIEKQHNKQQHSIPTTLAEALRLAADEAEEKERLQLENAEMKPKALFTDAVRGSTNSCLGYAMYGEGALSIDCYACASDFAQAQYSAKPFASTIMNNPILTEGTKIYRGAKGTVASVTYDYNYQGMAYQNRFIVQSKSIDNIEGSNPFLF